MGGRGASLGGSKKETGSNKNKSSGTNGVLERPDMKDIKNLNNLAERESFKDKVVFSDMVIIKTKDGKEKTFLNKSEHVEKQLKAGGEIVGHFENETTEPFRMDYNKYYSMGAPSSETEKSFSFDVTINKTASPMGLSSSLHRKLAKGERKFTGKIFVPKSAVRLVTENGKQRIEVKGWAIDKAVQSSKEYWNSRFEDRFFADIKL